MTKKDIEAQEKKIRSVTEKVLKSIKPSADEYDAIYKAISFLKQKLSAHLDADIIVGGSIAKDTFLRDARDIDIFVRFAANKKDISERLQKAIQEAGLTYTRVHGSRDYFRIDFCSRIFEIIPIIKISSPQQAQNITDISPLHVRWVRKYAQYADDIRLAKAFAKAHNIYGAESYIRGLSGYCLEILTIHYKGFIGLIRNVAAWKEKQVIDMTKTHVDVLSELNSSKTFSPLILIDPVDKDRNAAASLSTQRYQAFISAAQQFLKKPSLSSFQASVFSEKRLKRQAGEDDLYIITITTKQGKEDVIGCRILKVFEHIKKNLESHEFKICDAGFEYDKHTTGIVWFIVKEGMLKKKKLQTGPPINVRKHADDFKRKHPDAYEKDKRLYAKIDRKYRRSKDLMHDLLQDTFITQRVRSIEMIKK